MIEFCTKKKMVIAIVILLSLSLVTLIAESAWQTHQKPKEVTVTTSHEKFNTTCKSQKSIVIGECQKCTDQDIKQSLSFCEDTGYKQLVDCDHVQKYFRSCDISSSIARRNFWIFEGLVFLSGIVSYLFVRQRQRQLDSELLEKINKQIASGS